MQKESEISKRYLDPKNGGFVSGLDIYYKVQEELDNLHPRERFDWAKTYLSQWGHLKEVLRSPRFTALAEMLLSRNGNTNETTLSCEEVARRTGASVKTVMRLLSDLKKHDLVRPTRKGSWMINPRLFSTGSETKTKRLKVRYSTIFQGDYKQPPSDTLDYRDYFSENGITEGADD